eukprot:GSChrysophyteH1.ASY1.ANO1.1372.1 assembled CDS
MMDHAELEREEGPRDLSAAMVVLQTPTSSIEARVASLRFVQDFVMHGGINGHINPRLRKMINEQVLATVLQITMSDDRIPDVRRRQLIHAECFLIMGRLLGSNTLFGNVREQLDEIEASNETTRLLAEQGEAEQAGQARDDDTTEIEEYSASATSVVRRSSSAGNLNRQKKISTAPGDHTPVKRRVQLQNPIHSGKRASKAPPVTRGGDGSPEVKVNSPSDVLSPRCGLFADDEAVPDDTLTHMLPPIPDGYVNEKAPDSPDSVGTANTSITAVSENTASISLSPADTDSKPRPRLGPPGGWVREEKDDQSPQKQVQSPKKMVRIVGKSLSDAAISRDDTHTRQVGIMASSGVSLSSDLSYSKSTGPLSLLQPVLNKAPRKHLKNKRLAPRPSGFLSGEYELDNFAPGVDPTNWFEQDKRLGYQKSRMFFPVPGSGPDLDKSLMPAERSVSQELKPDAIVQEYLQMRAMLSYVSDLVFIPYTDKKKRITKTKEGEEALRREGHFASKSARPLRRLAGVVDGDLFNEALKQAMDIWSPLVGANIPKPKVRKYGANMHIKAGEQDPTQTQAALKLGDKYGEVPLPKENPWDVTPESPVKTGLNVIPDASDSAAGRSAERSVLVTRSVLRSLIRKEGADRQRMQSVMKHTMDVLNRSDYVSRTAVEQEQASLIDALDEQRRTVEQEISAIKELSVHTAAAQYATLPKRYLLLIEGKKANPRELIMRMTNVFCTLRSRNWLILAWGKWKTIVVLAEVERKKPIYARTAACYLMKEWATNRKLKQMKKQLQQWANNVAQCIFAERNRCVLPIQTQYRRYRDRCIILRMHLQGAYDGPLSDIELGKERDIPFKIPAVIRSTRRDIWFRVVEIQTAFRRFSVYRHTVKRRRQVILLQSVIRMFPKREIFKRLKYHVVRMQAYARRTIVRRTWCYMKIQAVIAQSYIRRYLGQLWKTRLFHKAWRIQEKRLGAVILIQCRWREYKAKTRVWKIVKNRADREWAALQFQRNWFRIKRAYHTFVLMCCLRLAEKEEAKFEAGVVAKGRYYNARTIQLPYADRFFRRNITAAVKIQCKYRGYHGYNVMEIMRREKWACRRLCHWARGALRRKSARARQIQKAWWNYKRGALLRHLNHTAVLQDKIYQKADDDKRYLAACRMQSLVLGIWARRWVIRTKAALKIQKPAKFYIARVGWKRQLRMRNRNAVRAWVEKTINVQLGFRVKAICKKHSRMMVKPQALARAYIVRKMMAVAMAHAHKYAMAVIKIQRLWRSNGAMSAAVAEVMMRRREATNPFRECSNIHKLLQMYFGMTKNMFSSRDPRAGMQVSTLLYRLGISYLAPMFPPRQFAGISDLQELDMPLLIEMYKEWQAYLDKKSASQGNRPSKRKLKLQVPKVHFQWLLDVVKSQFVPRAPSDIIMTQNASHFVENSRMCPQDAATDIQQRFIKKFGHAQASRAVNLGEKIKQQWFGYNNFKAFGEILTPGMIHRALEDSTDGGSVWTNAQNMIHRADTKELDQEILRDNARLRECADISQLACEQARVIFDQRGDDAELHSDNPIIRTINRAYNDVIGFRRRFTYMRDKMISDKKVHASERSADGKKGFSFAWALPNSTAKETLSASESTSLPFTGAKSDFELEMNMGIVKIYQEAFNTLYTTSSGIQSIKTKWFIFTVRKAIHNARTKRLMGKLSEDYQHKRHNNHVLDYWKKFKAADAATRKMRELMKALAEKKKLVQEILANVLRYGWEARIDDQGYEYYADTLDRGYDPTYDMPRYDPEQWEAMSMLQRRTRVLLERLRERRRLKEEARAKELAEIESKWLEEIKKGKKALPSTSSVAMGDIHPDGTFPESVRTQAERDTELSLPWAYRFVEDPKLLPGQWALLRPATDPVEADTKISSSLSEAEGPTSGMLCDCKNFYGVRTSGVNTSDIFLTNLEVGAKVEVRYEKAISFYKGKVVSFHENHLLETVYHILYDDGESEHKVTRDLIRLASDEYSKWFHIRNMKMKSAVLMMNRKNHYAMMRKNREKEYLENLFYRYKSYIEANPLEELKRITKRTELQKECIAGLFIDETHGKWFQQAEGGQRIVFSITKLPYRLGWIEELNKTPDSLEVVYRNTITGEETTTPPVYRPQHDFSARKLQTNWKIRRAKKYFQRLLASESLDEIVANAIKRYQKFAWVGYGQEGVTVMMTLRRMGFYLVADCIKEKFKFKEDQLKAITLEGLATTPPDMYERLGVVGMDKIKSMKGFQTWYAKTPPILREKNTQLLNYYVDVDDKRTLREVIDSGEPLISEKFIKLFPQGAVRTQKVVRDAVKKSVFPHTHAMVDDYLKRYGDKADLAKENIAELVSKKTTSNWKEEKEAYQVLWGATRRLKTLLGGLKVKQVEERRTTIIKKAGKDQKDMKTKDAENKKGRDLCSGPEARAALILRIKVMEYLQKVLWATGILQRQLRGFTKKSSVWSVIRRRRNAISLIQRTMRGCMDRAIAIDLREQQTSPWEQLWDANRELVYYYNRSTGKSTYLEPAQAYRPLVRDRLSQALVQAWPFIDADRQSADRNNFGLPPGLAAFAPALAMCCICNVRKCTRLCADCGAAETAAGIKGPAEMPYCFPCYTLSHSTDETENHKFKDAVEIASKDLGGLVCCMCTELPATRKCQGILDDRQIDDLCSLLQRSVSKLWPEILTKANVGGERKLTLLLEGVIGSSSDNTSASVYLSPSQLQQVRMMLERTRAECDEVYCDDCYREVHAGGKRLLHKWIGFKANAPVCSVCTRSPAEVVCKECNNSMYCNSCFRVFHSMGRKRKHRHSKLLEDLEYGQEYCQICSRRAGSVLCQNILGKGDDGVCRKRFCESCYECLHKVECDANAENIRNKELAFLIKKGQAEADPNLGDEETVCCVCGEEADQKCVDCGDLYCSRTWMGNPGCWATTHAKGNKQAHKTVTLASLAPAKPPPGGYAAYAPKTRKRST